MNAHVHIRDLAAGEIPFFSEFAERLFRETYRDTHAIMLDPYCARHFGPEVQARELAEDGAGVLLAEVDGDAAGYVQYRRRQAPVGELDARAVEIARFYVDRPHHGAGVAYRLMDAVLARAAAEGARVVWLQVAEYNDRAIAFYRKVGFEPAGRVPFDFAGIRELDYLLAKAVG